jgi:large subunit ribosomal protein L2
MAVIKCKPTSPGRRFVMKVVRDVHHGAPYEPLTEIKAKRGGRNNAGRITTRHQGGGHKKKSSISAVTRMALPRA